MTDSSKGGSRWQRVERILDEAFELTGSARREFLAQALEAAPELRTEVESVLAADERDGGLLDRPVGDFVSDIFTNRAGPAGEPEDRSGTWLGGYELIERLGWGGMGEVYRARDDSLHRIVAVKVLRSDLASDSGLVLRLQREARLLASLEHPRIARLYSFEEHEGRQLLAMELVDGETLADRLRRGAVAIDEALRVGAQIAEGLDAAHLLGVVHRDLKPGNVLLDGNGDARLVDFGIARSLEIRRDPAESGLESNSDLTGPGAMVGTTPYMSPEQVRGEAVDARSDVWALGCTLFECLTGKRPFQRPNAADTLSAILREEPDWSLLPPGVPQRVRRLLERMLRKDSRRRLRSAGDAGFDLLEAPMADEGADRLVVGTVPRRWGWIAAVAFGLLAAAAVIWVSRPSAPSARPVVRFEIPLQPGATLWRTGPSLALSPDGQTLVFHADRKLWIHRLDESSTREIPGTDHAFMPVFSPSGDEIAFWQTAGGLRDSFANGHVRRLSLRDGGAPITLAPVPSSPEGGMSWAEDGFIYFADDNGTRIVRVVPSGGDIEVIRELPAGEFAHGVRPLPGGRSLLFTRTTATSGRVVARPLWSEGDVVVAPLAGDSEPRVVVPRATDARYLPSGHLVFASDYQLLAMEFDLEQARTRGGALSLVDGVEQHPSGGSAQYTLSVSGDLVFLPGAPPGSGEQRLMWVDRDAVVEPLPFEPGDFSTPRLSPDGSLLAVSVRHQTRGESRHDIWIYEVDRGGRSRLTSRGDNTKPVWSANGEWVYFAHDAFEGPPNQDIWRRPVDQRQPAEPVLEMPGDQVPRSASADGTVLAFDSSSVDEPRSIWLLPLHDAGDAYPLAGAPSGAGAASLSPDGRYVAYAWSFESGGSEVYAQEIATGRRYVLSTDEFGGLFPVWSADGERVFYYSSRSGFVSTGCSACPGPQLLEVDVSFAPRFSVSPPRLVAEVAHAPFSQFAPTPDGRRFVVVQATNAASGPTPDRLTVVLNWMTELREGFTAPR